MRYIRTEYSFAKKEISGLHDRIAAAHRNNPTFSALWIKTNTNFEVNLSSDILLNAGFDILKGYYEVNQGLKQQYNEIIDDFVDICLANGGKRPPYSIYLNERFGVGTMPKYLSENRRNPRIVSQISADGIVIERSPPEWLSVGALAGKAGALSGASLAFLAVASNQWLLLVAIPGGIVLMGAATGIARGLEAGLHQSIERYIKKKLK